MKIKFLKDVQSGIGTFQEGQICELEDKYIIENWMENGLIEEVKVKKGRNKTESENEN